jgi:hypothetical protein
MEALRALTAAFGTAVAGCVLALDARAQEAADDSANPWSLTLTVAATNAYFFRCIPEEDRGAIVQPAFELDYEAHEGDGWLKEAWLGVGMFNSLHSGPTGTGGNTAEPPKAWYEADYYFTMQGKLEHGFELSMTWYEYTSPNSSFQSITEVDATVAWDDADLGNVQDPPAASRSRESCAASRNSHTTRPARTPAPTSGSASRQSSRSPTSAIRRTKRRVSRSRSPSPCC